MILEFVTQHADRLVQTGFHFLWQGTAIALLAWLACRLVFRKPSQRSFIYLLALVAMPVVVVVTFRSFDEPIARVSPSSENVPEMLEPIAISQQLDSDISASNELPSQTAFVSHWIVGGYFLGLLLMMLRVVAGYRWSHKVRRNGQAMREGKWPQALSTAVEIMKFRSQPLMMWSRNVSTPVVTGLIRPMIVLPVSLMNGLSMPQAVAVLSHELAHLKRFDHVIVLIQRLFESLFFFHPAVWLLSRGLDHEREKACDDLVVSAGTNPADYAEVLVLCASDQSEPLALAAAKNSQIKERVLRILNHQHKTSVQVNRGGWLLIAMTIVALGFLSLTPVQSQEKETDREEDGFVMIQEKLQIQIPVLDFKNATIEEAIAFLRSRSIELDPNPDPKERGLNFVVSNPKNGKDLGEVLVGDLFARNFTIEDALKAICLRTDSRYKVNQFAISILPNEGLKDGPTQLVTRRWKTPVNFLEFITPKAAAVQTIPTQELLKVLGISFPDGASAAYIVASNTLVVRNTPANMDLVDAIVKASIDPEKIPETKFAPIDKEKAEVQKIIIPVLDFEEATLEEAVQFLRLRSHELDPMKKGLNINIFGGKIKISENKIARLSLTNVPFTVALNYICDVTKTRYVREGRNISIFPIEK